MRHFLVFCDLCPDGAIVEECYLSEIEKLATEPMTSVEIDASLISDVSKILNEMEGSHDDSTPRH